MKNKSAAIILCFCLLLCAFFPHFSLAGSAEEVDMAQIVPYWEAAEFLAQELWNGVPDESGKIIVDISAFRVPQNDTNTLRDSALYHFPQNFFWTGGFSFGCSDGYLTSIQVTPSLGGTNLDAAQLAQKKEEFTAMLDALYALHDDSWTDLETVLFYNDYLAANYEYDRSYSIYDPYLFMARRTGVCQAYSAVFQLMMNRFGIPGSYASSKSINHIWNIVYIDGAWFHVDVTHNDPTRDRPGRIQHTCLLTGSETTALLNPDATDMTLGANVTISREDHPLRTYLESTISPVTWCCGEFYVILQTGNEANLVVLHPDAVSCDYGPAMPVKWFLTDGSGYFYPGNYSSLATDGDFLYYYDDRDVYVYDPLTDRRTVVASCASDVAFYGLQYFGGVLTAFTSTAPSGQTFTPMIIEDLPDPVYFTITWVIGEDVFYSEVREGSDPLESFNGSTERENENGVGFIFDGWSPEISPANEDTTYTATYIERQLYLPGDVNGDGVLNIDDVTELLNHLSDPSYIPAGVNAMNVDGDENDTIDVADVTALLNILSGFGG